YQTGAGAVEGVFERAGREDLVTPDPVVGRAEQKKRRRRFRRLLFDSSEASRPASSGLTLSFGQSNSGFAGWPHYRSVATVAP
ncbi:MAG: hypothetical protein IKQ97_10265, partial [Eubacterium sp.]|nr:hypothetical protein [Eubacterium sp.]